MEGTESRGVAAPRRAVLSLRLNRFDEALVGALRAYEPAPLFAPNSLMMSEALFYSSRHGQAVEQSRRALELKSNYGPMYSDWADQAATAPSRIVSATNL